MKLQQRHRAYAGDINYHVSVVVHHEGSDLSGTLTVVRRACGKFWEARLFVSPNLHMTMGQFATPINGGFGHLSDEHFLDHVRLVFSFSGGADFDFVFDAAGLGLSNLQ